MVYFLFFLVETIGLSFNESGFDLLNSIIYSVSQLSSGINFGVFIAFILLTANLLKEKTPITVIFKFGLIVSLIFGGFIFVLSNTIVPEVRSTSYLNRYENIRKTVFTPQERADKLKELKKTHCDMMSIQYLNEYTDSLSNKNVSQKKIITELFQKTPDSIIQSNFSKKELEEYGITETNLTTKFNRSNVLQLKEEIMKNRLLTKQIRKAEWTILNRYLNSFLCFFFVCFALVIGINFKNQLLFPLVCIGIVIYTQTLTLTVNLSDYFVKGENIIGLIFKIVLVFIVFLYLVYQIKNNKKTSTNKHSSTP